VSPHSSPGYAEGDRGSMSFPTTGPHCGLSPQLEKGRSQPLEGFRTGWFHVRQSKHHRWSLDAGQIYQYHLGGELHPAMRWWEAVNVPRRVLHFIEFGEGFTVVILICEDLAQNDEVADLIRAVGPTGIMTPLLEGPYPGQGVGLGGQERAAQVRTAVMTTSATSLGWEIITTCESAFDLGHRRTHALVAEAVDAGVNSPIGGPKHRPTGRLRHAGVGAASVSATPARGRGPKFHLRADGRAASRGPSFEFTAWPS
jgi:hypothetical protein